MLKDASLTICFCLISDHKYQKLSVTPTEGFQA